MSRCSTGGEENSLDGTSPNPNRRFSRCAVLADKPEPPLGSVEIVLANGRCVHVGVGFDPHTLVRVVELLEDGGRSC